MSVTVVWQLPMRISPAVNFELAHWSASFGTPSLSASGNQPISRMSDRVRSCGVLTLCVRSLTPS